MAFFIMEPLSSSDILPRRWLKSSEVLGSGSGLLGGTTRLEPNPLPGRL